MQGSTVRGATGSEPVETEAEEQRMPGQEHRTEPRIVAAVDGSPSSLGQFTDLPADVVFTVEYSVHGAMRAVYGLFGVGKEIPRGSAGSPLVLAARRV
jgi:oleate hydratase